MSEYPHIQSIYSDYLRYEIQSKHIKYSQVKQEQTDSLARKFSVNAQSNRQLSNLSAYQQLCNLLISP